MFQPGDKRVALWRHIGKARSLLGWEPAVQLDDGLMRTVEYFQRLLDRGNVPA